MSFPSGVYFFVWVMNRLWLCQCLFVFFVVQRAAAVRLVVRKSVFCSLEQKEVRGLGGVHETLL